MNEWMSDAFYSFCVHGPVIIRPIGCCSIFRQVMLGNTPIISICIHRTLFNVRTDKYLMTAVARPPSKVSMFICRWWRPERTFHVARSNCVQQAYFLYNGSVRETPLGDGRVDLVWQSYRRYRRIAYTCFDDIRPCIYDKACRPACSYVSQMQIYSLWAGTCTWHFSNKIWLIGLCTAKIE